MSHSKCLGRVGGSGDVLVYQIAGDPEEEPYVWRLFFNTTKVSYDEKYHGYRDLAKAVADSSGGRYQIDLSALDNGIITIYENPAFKGKENFDGEDALGAVMAVLRKNSVA